MKVLIFDSGPLINFAMNGMLYLIERLKEDFDGKFIITNYVKEEVYDRPVNVKRFELEALRIKSLIDKGVLEMSSSLVAENELEKETQTLMDIINSSLMTEGQEIKLVSLAETSCMALSNILNKKEVENIIAIDERTARLISEKPENLINLMSKKLHKKVSLVNPEIRKLKNLRFIRSPELAYVAFKKDLSDLKGRKALEALIYATKFKGSSISFEEIEELKKL